MFAAVDPAHNPNRVEERRAGKLGGVADLRRAPILAKARGVVFEGAAAQIAIAQEMQQVEPFETHGRIRALAAVGDAAARLAKPRAELAGLLRRADDDEAHLHAGIAVLSVELAQLRERFTEERSTDVTQPDDQRRQGHGKLRDGVGDSRADRRFHHAVSFAVAPHSHT